MGKIGQARGFLFFRIVNKFFFRKRKKNKKGNRGMTKDMKGQMFGADLSLTKEDI